MILLKHSGYKAYTEQYITIGRMADMLSARGPLRILRLHGISYLYNYYDRIFQHYSCDYFAIGRSSWWETYGNPISHWCLCKQSSDQDACKCIKEGPIESTHKVNLLWLLKFPWYACWIKNYDGMNHAVYPNCSFFIITAWIIGLCQYTNA